MEHSTSELPKKKKSKNKKRFSDDQIRSLEAIFESETKLEPRKKVQLARELGLQPRQIAIWFQNRRARWKSKQMEREYKVLKANYEHLASQFEFLAKEKQSLLIQLQKLSELFERHQDQGSSKNGEAKKPILLQELDQEGLSRSSQQDHVGSKNSIGRYGDQEVTMNNEDCSLGSLEKLCNLESSGGLIDQPPGNLQWWNIWT